MRDFLLRAKAVLKIPKKMKNERPRPRLTAVHPELCDCTSDSKVPDAWVDFLLDQCGPRKQCLAGVKRRRLKLEESWRERKEICSFETLFHFFPYGGSVVGFNKTSRVPYKAIPLSFDNTDLCTNGEEYLSQKKSPTVETPSL